MGTVVTLTLNPALDVSTDTEKVFPGEKLRCGPTSYDPGGGGVNVSRVLHRIGVPTRAVYVAGGLTGDFFTELLAAEQVPTHRLAIDGQTRESFTVTERHTGQQYRFVLAGPTIDPTVIERVGSALGDMLVPGDWLVMSGSLPPGAPPDLYGTLTRRFSDAGVHVAVDTSSPWLGPALDQGVELVKPSRQELEDYLGYPLATRPEQVQAARDLIERHGVGVVALSLGREGAVLVTGQGAWHAVAEEVKAVSAVGAGDSFLAGLIAGLHRGLTGEQALAFAVAAGTSAALSPATGLCSVDTLEGILPTVATTTMGP